MQLQSLPLAEWEQTKMTLHLYLQIVGKIRMSLMPRKNHWWGITLYVNQKGITTNAMPYQDGMVEIQFDFINHKLEVTTSQGDYSYFDLQEGLSVAAFYKKITGIFEQLSIPLKIIAKPYSLPDANPIQTPFAEMDDYKTYQKEYAGRFWKILLWVDKVFDNFSGRFYGKTCLVQIYWHHMDMAVTRFSGNKVPLDPAMSIANKDAYSHEVISFGFWAGDDMVPAPAFYAYAHPSPANIEKEHLQPATAKWVESNGSQMGILMYDDLLTESNPEVALTNFLESTYQAAAKLNKWNLKEFAVPALQEL